MFFLSDTVGFVSNLPHDLVKAFRTTLEEVREANLLLHVIDYSNPNYKKQMQVTIETLNEIGAGHIPVINVYNKSELTTVTLPSIKENEAFISAKNRIGINELVGMIEKHVFKLYIECIMLIPYNEGNIVSYLNENANVQSVEHRSDGTLLYLQCKESDFKRLNQYIQSNKDLPLAS